VLSSPAQGGLLIEKLITVSPLTCTLAQRSAVLVLSKHSWKHPVSTSCRLFCAKARLESPQSIHFFIMGSAFTGSEQALVVQPH